MIEADTIEEAIELTVQIMGWDRQYVESIAAIEQGEVAGDIVLVDEDGQPLPVEEQRALLYPEESE